MDRWWYSLDDAAFGVRQNFWPVAIVFAGFNKPEVMQRSARGGVLSRTPRVSRYGKIRFEPRRVPMFCDRDAEVVRQVWF
jgi:hypothetical protein